MVNIKKQHKDDNSFKYPSYLNSLSEKDLRSLRDDEIKNLGNDTVEEDYFDEEIVEISYPKENSFESIDITIYFKDKKSD